MTAAVTECIASCAASVLAASASMAQMLRNKSLKNTMSPWKEYHCVRPKICLVNPRLTCTKYGFHHADSTPMAMLTCISVVAGGSRRTICSNKTIACVYRLESSGSRIPLPLGVSAGTTLTKCHSSCTRSPPHQSHRPEAFTKSSLVFFLVTVRPLLLSIIRLK